MASIIDAFDLDHARTRKYAGSTSADSRYNRLPLRSIFAFYAVAENSLFIWIFRDLRIRNYLPKLRNRIVIDLYFLHLVPRSISKNYSN